MITLTVTDRAARLLVALLVASVALILGSAVMILVTWPAGITIPAGVGTVIVVGVLAIVGRPRSR